MATTREPAPLVTRGEAMCIRAMKPEERTASFVASTEAVDSYGDIVDQASWQLDHFKANPIVLYGHNSRELPIGKATDIAVRNGQLEATIKFASAEANPRAEEVWRLIQEGILRAVSVGFVPTDGKSEVRDGKDVFVWRSPVLKEISVVPVPANHEALARLKAAFASTHDSETPALPGTNPRNAEETAMDPKELTAKIEKQAVELAEMGAKVKALETEKNALEKQCESLVKSRDEALARASKSEDGLIELEVEALVGKKITPAEKADFVELRKTNTGLFRRMVEQRSAMTLDTTVTPVEREAVQPRTVSNGSASANLLADVKKLAGIG